VRLQLRTGALLVPAAAVMLLPHAVSAEDQVTIRSAYFREPSTRVVQPVVEISKDLPNGYGVTAHYLLDAITSASASAGTGVDSIFTEFRSEVGLKVLKDFGYTRLTARYSYSAESDYWSHTVSAALAQRFWGDTGTVSLSFGRSFDTVAPRGRTPACAKSGEFSCALDAYFGGVGYSQVLSSQLVAQLSYELAYLDGFQSNPYRSGANGYENLPAQRTRHALSPKVAYYFPSAGVGLQLHYRYYRDTWGIKSHMAEGRVYLTLTQALELRLSYRHYFQTPANFWCDFVTRPDCYGAGAVIYGYDPKLENVRTYMPEAKLVWEAAALRGTPFLGWFAAGTIELSYARLFQSTSFNNAHLLQVGYTMPY